MGVLRTSRGGAINGKKVECQLPLLSGEDRKSVEAQDVATIPTRPE